MNSRTSQARAWALLGFLTFLNILNFADRLLPTSLGKQIEDDLGFAHEKLGLLSGFYFIVTYAFATLVFGALSDRWRRPRIIGFGMTLAGAMMAASALSQNFMQLAAARMMYGAGIAALTPAALSLLGDAFPGERRGFAAGVYYAGLPIGIGLSLFTAGALAERIGWRGCYALFGGITLAGAPLAVWMMREPRRKGEGGGFAGWSELRDTIATAQRGPLALTLLGASLIVLFAAAGNMRMVWLQKDLGFDVSIGMTSGLIYIAGGICGNLAGGWLGDLVERRLRGGRLWFAGATHLALAPAAILFYRSGGDEAWFYAAWFATIFVASAYYGPIYSSVQEMVAPRRRATSVGLLIFTVNMIGVTLGPWMVGWIGDRRSLGLGLTTAACISLLAPVCFFIAAAMKKNGE